MLFSLSASSESKTTFPLAAPGEAGLDGRGERDDGREAEDRGHLRCRVDGLRSKFCARRGRAEREEVDAVKTEL